MKSLNFYVGGVALAFIVACQYGADMLHIADLDGLGRNYRYTRGEVGQPTVEGGAGADLDVGVKGGVGQVGEGDVLAETVDNNARHMIFALKLYDHLVALIHFEVLIGIGRDIEILQKLRFGALIFGALWV